MEINFSTKTSSMLFYPHQFQAYLDILSTAAYPVVPVPVQN